MNKNIDCEPNAKGKRGPRRDGRTVRRNGTPVRSRGAAPHVRGSGAVLHPEAARLASCLARSDAEAFIDPTEGGMVIVRHQKGGVSIGGGRFSLAIAQVLVSHASRHGRRPEQARARCASRRRAVRISGGAPPRSRIRFATSTATSLR